MNVAHQEIDLFDPRSNSLTAGFTQEERNNFTKLLNNGFIDVYRHLNPDKKDAYTFWTYLYNARIKNEGWRLDYVIVSERMKDKIQECAIRNDIQGSDHCPIVAQFKLPHNNRKREVFPCISTHKLNGSELESSDYNSSGEENNEPARLLPIQTRQSKKTEETKSKTLPKSSGRPKIRPSIIPPKSKDSSSKPSVSGTQQVITTKTRVNLRQPTTLRRTTPTLDESTIGKNLLRRRMEERRNQNRPNYQESSTESDEESRNESDASIPPILRKNRSVLPSLDLPLAAFPSPKVPKSAPAKTPGHFQELFQEESDQEQLRPVEEQKGPIIYVTAPHSDSDDSSSDEERNENENSKLTRAELQKSISQFNESLKTHKEWIEEDKEDENAVPTREVTAISEGEDDEELLNAIEELEPDSDTELTQRINSVIHWAQEEVAKIKARNDKEEKDTKSSSQVKEDKKRKSVTFATQQKLSDTPDTMGTFRPSEIGVPQALSTPFQHTDKIMEEAYPKSPIKSSENHMPRRVKMGRLEPNYTTATVEPPVETFKNHQTHAFITEMHEPTMQAPVIEQTRTSITSIQPALPALYTQTSYSNSSPYSELKDHSNELQINLQICRENLTYLKGNYVHFLSADCEFVTPVGRLLIDIGAIDPQDMKEKRPEIGTILITPRGRYKIYTVIVKHKHFDKLQEENLRIGLHNLHTILKQEDVKSFRISKQGDLTETLPRGKFIEILKEIFKNSNINITVCHGNVCVPFEEDRVQIITENHQSKIGGHNGVNKTYKRIRERFFWPGIKEQITEFVRKCSTCQEQKIVRAQTHEPMIITDTPIDTFDTVSLDTVGPLPRTPDGNRHILTMQDNL